MHAWNGTWGVIAVGMFAAPDLITNSYGTSITDGSQRPFGFIFPGGGGHLLAAQIAYALFICGALHDSPQVEMSNLAKFGSCWM